MASSSGIRKYPQRLYPVGKAPIQNRSMNHSCYLANFQTIKEAVGEDVWTELRESAIGVFVKLKEMRYIWSAKAVHHFLANQLAIESRHEIWSLIDCMPIRFSLYEFGQITGLNCDPYDKNDGWDVDHREFWLEMNVPTSQGPTYHELVAIFPICRNWCREKRLMVGLLALLSIGIFGLSKNSRIPLHCAKRVMEPAAFQRFPWGRFGFTSIVESIKVLTYEGKESYCVHGCVHALLIWIYEYVPGIGEKYGNRIGGEVPLLSWEGSRTRINFSDFCDQEKRQYQKVRVRHMIMKPMEERYPKWENDEIDTDLDNLIRDILDGQLNEKFWDETPTTNCEKKRKYGVSASVVPNVIPSTKRKKVEEPDHGGGSSDMLAAHTVAIRGLVESITTLTGKVENIDVSVAEKISNKLEGIIEEKVDARMGAIETEFMKKIARLEEEVSFLKKKPADNISHGVADSNHGDSEVDKDDDGSSNELSWKIQTKISSHDGAPIQCVVKKEKKGTKKTEKEELKTQAVPLKKVKKEKDDEVPLKKVKKEKADEVPLKKVKEEKKDEVSLKKVKKEKAFLIPQLNDESVSTEGWQAHLKWEKTEKCRLVLEQLAASIDEPTQRRKPQLTKTQVWPYVGNSTVKRIITGVNVSKKAYDPLAKVEYEKLHKVLDFIKQDLEQEEISYGDNSAQFYLRLMVPRETWPRDNYGWLSDSAQA